MFDSNFLWACAAVTCCLKVNFSQFFLRVKALIASCGLSSIDKTGLMRVNSLD